MQGSNVGATGVAPVPNFSSTTKPFAKVAARSTVRANGYVNPKRRASPFPGWHSACATSAKFEGNLQAGFEIEAFCIPPFFADKP